MDSSNTDRSLPHFAPSPFSRLLFPSRRDPDEDYSDDYGDDDFHSYPGSSQRSAIDIATDTSTDDEAQEADVDSFLFSTRPPPTSSRRSTTSNHSRAPPPPPPAPLSNVEIDTHPLTLSGLIEPGDAADDRSEQAGHSDERIHATYSRDTLVDTLAEARRNILDNTRRSTAADRTAAPTSAPVRAAPDHRPTTSATSSASTVASIFAGLGSRRVDGPSQFALRRPRTPALDAAPSRASSSASLAPPPSAPMDTPRSSSASSTAKRSFDQAAFSPSTSPLGAQGSSPLASGILPEDRGEGSSTGAGRRFTAAAGPSSSTVTGSSPRHRDGSAHKRHCSARRHGGSSDSRQEHRHLARSMSITSAMDLSSDEASSDTEPEAGTSGRRHRPVSPRALTSRPSFPPALGLDPDLVERPDSPPSVLSGFAASILGSPPFLGDANLNAQEAASAVASASLTPELPAAHSPGHDHGAEMASSGPADATNSTASHATSARSDTSTTGSLSSRIEASGSQGANGDSDTDNVGRSLESASARPPQVSDRVFRDFDTHLSDLHAQVVRARQYLTRRGTSVNDTGAEATLRRIQAELARSRRTVQTLRESISQSAALLRGEENRANVGTFSASSSRTRTATSVLRGRATATAAARRRPSPAGRDQSPPRTASRDELEEGIPFDQFDWNYPVTGRYRLEPHSSPWYEGDHTDPWRFDHEMRLRTSPEGASSSSRTRYRPTASHRPTPRLYPSRDQTAIRSDDGGDHGDDGINGSDQDDSLFHAESSALRPVDAVPSSGTYRSRGLRAFREARRGLDRTADSRTTRHLNSSRTASTLHLISRARQTGGADLGGTRSELLRPNSSGSRAADASALRPSTTLSPRRSRTAQAAQRSAAPAVLERPGTSQDTLQVPRLPNVRSGSPLRMSFGGETRRADTSTERPARQESASLDSPAAAAEGSSSRNTTRPLRPLNLSSRATTSTDSTPVAPRPSPSRTTAISPRPFRVLGQRSQREGTAQQSRDDTWNPFSSSLRRRPVPPPISAFGEDDADEAPSAWMQDPIDVLSAPRAWTSRDIGDAAQQHLLAAGQQHLPPMLSAGSPGQRWEPVDVSRLHSQERQELRQANADSSSSSLDAELESAYRFQASLSGAALNRPAFTVSPDRSADSSQRDAATSTASSALRRPILLGGGDHHHASSSSSPSGSSMTASHSQAADAYLRSRTRYEALRRFVAEDQAHGYTTPSLFSRAARTPISGGSTSRPDQSAESSNISGRSRYGTFLDGFGGFSSGVEHAPPLRAARPSQESRSGGSGSASSQQGGASRSTGSTSAPASGSGTSHASGSGSSAASARGPTPLERMREHERQTEEIMNMLQLPRRSEEELLNMFRPPPPSPHDPPPPAAAARGAAPTTTAGAASRSSSSARANQRGRTARTAFPFDAFDDVLWHPRFSDALSFTHQILEPTRPRAAPRSAIESLTPFTYASRCGPSAQGQGDGEAASARDRKGKGKGKAREGVASAGASRADMEVDVVEILDSGDEGSAPAPVLASSSSGSSSTAPAPAPADPEPESTLAPTCPICLDDYAPADLLVESWCNHVFHEACLKSWLESASTCPMCRRHPPAASTPSYGHAHAQDDFYAEWPTLAPQPQPQVQHQAVGPSPASRPPGGSAAPPPPPSRHRWVYPAGANANASAGEYTVQTTLLPELDVSSFSSYMVPGWERLEVVPSTSTPPVPPPPAAPSPTGATTRTRSTGSAGSP